MGCTACKYAWASTFAVFILLTAILKLPDDAAFAQSAGGPLRNVSVDFPATEPEISFALFPSQVLVKGRVLGPASRCKSTGLICPSAGGPCNPYQEEFLSMTVKVSGSYSVEGGIHSLDLTIIRYVRATGQQVSAPERLQYQFALSHNACRVVSKRMGTTEVGHISRCALLPLANFNEVKPISHHFPRDVWECR